MIHRFPHLDDIRDNFVPITDGTIHKAPAPGWILPTVPMSVPQMPERRGSTNTHSGPRKRGSGTSLNDTADSREGVNAWKAVAKQPRREYLGIVKS